jgi:osomolarity two-component system response regulator SKN7
MLESPQDESVVRWGNEGDSFVVLEVRIPPGFPRLGFANGPPAEREVYKAHPAQTFQAQQLCQFRASTQQIRLPQSPA